MTEAHVINRLPQAKLGFLSPYQVLYKIKRVRLLRLCPTSWGLIPQNAPLVSHQENFKGFSSVKEVDPAKVKAIQEMLPPRTEKEIRGFLGRVQYNTLAASYLN